MEHNNKSTLSEVSKDSQNVADTVVKIVEKIGQELTPSPKPSLAGRIFGSETHPKGETIMDGLKGDMTSVGHGISNCASHTKDVVTAVFAK